MKKQLLTSALIASALFPLPIMAQSPSPERKVMRKENKSMVARIVQGQVTAVSDSSLMVSSNGKTYTVTVDSNTKMRRQFGGESSLTEASVGDKVNVWGKFTDDTKTTIQAALIRNVSVMKRKGAFLGIVTAKTDTTLTLQTKERGVQTVMLGGSIKFINRKGGVMTAAQINVNDKIRVRGVWDKTNSKIIEVTEVKDFSFPVRPSPSPRASH